MRQPDHAPWAVLTDMDGTLLDTEDGWHAAVAGLVADRTGATSPELVALLEGETLTNAARLLGRALGLRADLLEAELQSRSFREFRRGVHWRPGARELLDELAAASVPVALVTSAPRAWMQLFAERVDLSMFHIAVTADDVVRHKPHPQPYRYAARLLGMPVERCVVLEDSAVGARSAAAAGCGLVVVGASDAAWMPAGAHTVDTMHELSLATLSSLALEPRRVVGGV